MRSSMGPLQSTQLQFLELDRDQLRGSLKVLIILRSGLILFAVCSDAGETWPGVKNLFSGVSLRYFTLDFWLALLGYSVLGNQFKVI